MTIQIDDAGYGDLLFGAIIGAYRPETDQFVYDVIDVRYFKEPLFEKREYLNEARRIAWRLVEKLRPVDDEMMELCRGDILDMAADALIKAFGQDRIVRVKVEGRAQHLVEEAYLDEIRNLGYEPLPERMEKWGKSFWHMYRWLRENPKMIRYAKSGWPRLQRFRLFRRRNR
jgi:hypothetical protein